MYICIIMLKQEPVIPIVVLDQSLCSPISKPNEVYKDGKRSLISGIANLLLSNTMANRKRRGGLKVSRKKSQNIYSIPQLSLIG